jgi:hypothetical protein
MTVFDDACVLVGGMAVEELEMNAVRPVAPHRRPMGLERVSRRPVIPAALGNLQGFCQGEIFADRQDGREREQ